MSGRSRASFSMVLITGLLVGGLFTASAGASPRGIADETEPNDTAGTADALGCGVSFSAAISSFVVDHLFRVAADSDYFVLPLTAGTQVTVNATFNVAVPDQGFRSATEPFLEVWRNAAAVGGGSFASATQQVAFTADTSDSYIIKVTGGGMSGAYTLTTTCTAPPAPPSIPPDGSGSGFVGAGGSLSTDHHGNGATEGAPVEVGITSPGAGNVSVAEGESAGVSGYSVLGHVVSISAPDGTPENPLVITFTLDSSLFPGGLDPSDVVIFRNGVAVPACTGAAGVADPDPCLSVSGTAGDDYTFTVLTSHASTWLAAGQRGCRGQVATIVGTAGDDTLTGTAGDDVIWAGPGDDTVDGLGGDDVICLGSGADEGHGGAGHDRIFGAGGADTIYGGSSRDVLAGGNADDTLFGEAGNDTLRGGVGTDTADGGDDTDKCLTVETVTACEA